MTDEHVKDTMEEFLLSHGYQMGKTIGEGTYSKVKEAFSKKHQRKVAVKIIDKMGGPEGKSQEKALSTRQIRFCQFTHLNRGTNRPNRLYFPPGSWDPLAQLPAIVIETLCKSIAIPLNRDWAVFANVADQIVLLQHVANCLLLCRICPFCRCFTRIFGVGWGEDEVRTVN